MPVEDGDNVVLKWTDHYEVYARLMSILRGGEVFSDVILACGNRSYAAHKFVLSTCSVYLEKMLAKAQGEVVTIVLADTPHQAVEGLLDFMYLGQVDLSPDHLDPLLDLAHELRIRGLTQPKYDPQAEQVREAMRREREERQKKMEPKQNEERMREDKEREIKIKEEAKEREEDDSEHKVIKVEEGNGERASVHISPVKIEAEMEGNGRERGERSESQGENGDIKIEEGIGTDAKFAEFKRAEVERAGVERGGVERTGVERAGVERAGVERAGVERAGVERTGVERAATTPRGMQCKKCQLSFQTFEQLDIHLMSHMEKNLIPCPECPFRTLRLDDLRIHITNKHATRKIYVCPYCKIRHTLEKVHVKHQRTEHPNNPVVIRMAPPMFRGRPYKRPPPSIDIKKPSTLNLIKPSCVLIRDIGAQVNKFMRRNAEIAQRSASVDSERKKSAEVESNIQSESGSSNVHKSANVESNIRSESESSQGNKKFAEIQSPGDSDDSNAVRNIASPSHNVLNSPDSPSLSPSTPTSSHHFSITSPSISPIPQATAEPPSTSTGNSSSSTSASEYQPTTPVLSGSQSPLPLTQPCFVQLIRDSSPSSTLSSESEKPAPKRIKNIRKQVSRNESPVSRNKAMKRGGGSSANEDPLRTSSPSPSIVSLSSDNSQTPSPQPLKKIRKETASVSIAKNVLQSREK